MIIAKDLTELRAALDHFAGRRLAFVPTMGNLHAGHLELTTAARRHADVVAVSIYVNPLQFGPQEDFGAYPRTLAEDRAKLESRGVEVLFLPDDQIIYPRGMERHTRVEVPRLGQILCGASRPGHFTGVTTVVNRLFNLLRPQVAVFGNKDYQQLLLIRMMVADLGMGIDIVGVETVRESDGLALSSRNAYLDADQRARAPRLYAALQQVQAGLGEGLERGRAETRAVAALAAGGFAPEYVSVRRLADLGVPGPADRALVVLAAAQLGPARLIDNLEFQLNSPIR